MGHRGAEDQRTVASGLIRTPEVSIGEVEKLLKGTGAMAYGIISYWTNANSTLTLHTPATHAFGI